MDLGIDGITDAEPIGSGGFANVYRATQPSHDRVVAVKIVTQPVTPRIRELFDRERAAMGRLASTHNGILGVYESGLTPAGQPYLVMPLCPDGSLQDRLDDFGALPERQVVEWGTQIARAIGHAHAHRILHRDLKPSNVLLVRPAPDEQLRALVADFGVASLIDATMTAGSALTPAFSPPEVLRGDAWTELGDVYSLGATLYTLLSGTSPFARPTIAATLYAVAHDQAPDLRALGISDQLAGVIERMMAREPERRTPSMAVAASELDALAVAPGIAGGPATRPDGPVPSAANLPAAADTTPAAMSAAPPDQDRPGGSRRSAWLIAAAAASVAALAVAATLVWWPSEDADEDDSATVEATSTSDARSESDGDVTSPGPTGEASDTEACGSLASQFPDMVCVPAAAATVGIDEARVPEEELSVPTLVVEVDALLIDRTEVTNAFYARYLASLGDNAPPAPSARSESPYDWVDGSYPEGTDDHPVVLVTQAEAAAYCVRQGKRLPTEFEWEHAARGPDGLLYPWGDAYDASRTRAADTIEPGAQIQTVPVDSFPDGASPFGALGMAGNVWEWTSSELDVYPGGDEDLLSDQPAAVSRGGSWDSPAIAVSTIVRNWDDPELRAETIGFRCAR